MGSGTSGQSGLQRSLLESTWRAQGHVVHIAWVQERENGLSELQHRLERRAAELEDLRVSSQASLARRQVAVGPFEIGNCGVVTSHAMYRVGSTTQAVLRHITPLQHDTKHGLTVTKGSFFSSVCDRESEAAVREQVSGAAVAAAEDRRRDLESWEARTRKVGQGHMA